MFLYNVVMKMKFIQVELFNIVRKIVYEENIVDRSYTTIPMNFAQGTYMLKVEYTEELFLHHETIKIVVL